MSEQQPSKDIIWGVRPIADSPEKLLSQLNRKEWYLPKLGTMSTDNRKAEWLSIRGLLKELLSEEKEILYTETGRPYLSDHSYHISISHTKGYVAIILSKEYPVGIDIEYISPRIKKIRSKFMSPEEESTINPKLEEVHLLLHWSAKETMFKVLDTQNVDFQQHLHIDKFNPVIDTLSSFTSLENRTEHNHQFTIHYFVNQEYVLTFTSIS